MEIAADPQTPPRLKRLPFRELTPPRAALETSTRCAAPSAVALSLDAPRRDAPSRAKRPLEQPEPRESKRFVFTIKVVLSPYFDDEMLATDAVLVKDECYCGDHRPFDRCCGLEKNHN